MTTLDIEQIDLATLLPALQEAFVSPPVGAVTGRTEIRDFVADHLSCSELEAEQLVDTLVVRHLVELEPTDDGREVWRISSSP